MIVEWVECLVNSGHHFKNCALVIFLTLSKFQLLPFEKNLCPLQLYTTKERPHPEKSNNNITVLDLIGSFQNLETSFSKDPSVKFTFGKSSQLGMNSTVKEWKLNIDGGGMNGLCWRYDYYLPDVLCRDLSDFKNRKYFVPGNHSCHWFIHEAMSGFQITITQVLRCKFIEGWRKHVPGFCRQYISNPTESKWMQICPKMAHTIKITFNDLENFNENFKNLKNSKGAQYDFNNILLSKNTSQKESLKCSKNSKIGSIDVERSVMDFNFC